MIEAIIVIVVLAVFLITAINAPELGMILVVVLAGVFVYFGVKDTKEHQQKIETAPCRDFSDAPITEVPARCKAYFETETK
jgi:Ca2+/Na+ antiporter